MNTQFPRSKKTAKVTLGFLDGFLLKLFLSAFLLTPVFAPQAFAGSQSAAQEMSDTVEDLCPKLFAQNLENPFPDGSTEMDVLNRCSEVKINTGSGQEFDTLTSAQKNGLANMNSEETSTMQTMSVEITQAQFVSVLGRLQALRGGTPGHLAMKNSRPQSLPLLFAGPVTYLPPDEGDGNDSIGDGARFGMFLNGSTGTGDKDPTNLEPGFDYDGWGLTLGSDYRFTDRFVLGGAIGYSEVDAEIDSNAGDAESKGYALSLYSLYQWENVYINAIGAIGTRDLDTVRNVSYTVTVPVVQRFKGNTDATDYDLSLGAGYDFFAGGFTLGPYAQLRYFRSEIDGYSEHLSGDNSNPGFGLALGIEDQNIQSLTSTLGGQASYALSTGFGVLQPYLRLGWIHEFKNEERTIRARFLNVPDEPVINAANHVRIHTDEPDENYLDLALGLSAVFPRGIQAFVNYQTLLGLSDITSHLVSAGVRLEI